MTLLLHNSLTRRKEPFIPTEPGHARIYTCGPTVHDFAHIGNFRTFLFEDLLRRALRWDGLRVTQAMNLTDVDDKTIRKSQAQGIPLMAFTARYKTAFFEDLDTLRIERAEHYPEATAHIPEMIAMIQALLDRGLAYASGGSIWFRVAADPGYGRLVDLQPGATKDRALGDEYDDTDARDFALWKGRTEADGPVYWASPWGQGRPGWHIECSAMSTALLGDSFDIHTGGIDNRFPHHENEIAQSVGATGSDFAKVWMHSAHLQIEGEKMSKSDGNIVGLRTLVEQGHEPATIRYALLAAHYRSPLQLNASSLTAAAHALDRLRGLDRRLAATSGMGMGLGEPFERGLNEVKARFAAALRDDLNLPGALGHHFAWVRGLHALLNARDPAAGEVAAARAWMTRVDEVLDVLQLDETTHDRSDEVRQLALARDEARRLKQWGKADALRDAILALGYSVEDKPEGTAVHRTASVSG